MRGVANRWRTFDARPPKQAQAKTLYFRQAGGLSFSPPTSGDNERRPEVNFEFDQFVSDPALEEDMTLAGPIQARLQVATTGSDADWVVKIIDVYPDDTPDDP